MIEYPYLVAFALIEQNGERAMPLGGKSLRSLIEEGENPGKRGEEIAFELLLRVFQKSDEGGCKRAEGEKSLLLIQISMENMQKEIPHLKKKWIDSGNSELFFKNLETICQGVWTLSFSRAEGMRFTKYNCH